MNVPQIHVHNSGTDYLKQCFHAFFLLNQAFFFTFLFPFFPFFFLCIFCFFLCFFLSSNYIILIDFKISLSSFEFFRERIAFSSLIFNYRLIKELQMTLKRKVSLTPKKKKANFSIIKMLKVLAASLKN